MSNGFFFPPPPPPPPKNVHATQFQHADRPHGRGRGGARGNANFVALGRGQTNGFSNPVYARQATGGQFGGWEQQTPARPPGSYVNPPFSSSQDTVRSVSPQSSSSIARGGISVSPGRTTAGHKRKLDALRGPRQDNQKLPAPATAPAVPSFGPALLPVKPSATTSHPKPTEAKVARIERVLQTSQKRTSLGLTPKSNSVNVQHSSDSGSEDGDQDHDEETMFAELGEKLTFEHNGVVMSLKSKADLEVWKQERQRNWPTRARMDERNEARKRVGEERKRLLGASRELRTSKLVADKISKAQQPSPGATQQLAHEQQTGPEEVSEWQKQKTRLEEQTRTLEELRRKVADSEARNRKAQTKVEPQTHEQTPPAVEKEQKNGPVALVEDKNDAASKIVEEKEEDGEEDLSSSSSDASSTSSSDASEDPGPPEELASKPATPPVAPSTFERLCKNFTDTGYCRHGETCRFKHQRPTRTPGQQPQRPEPHVQATSLREPRPPKLETMAGEKKSIFQRLKEQEELERDKLALQVVKYLGGQAGFFRATDESLEHSGN